MSSFVIAFSSTTGQTEKIAKRIESWLAERHIQCELLNLETSDGQPKTVGPDGFILLGSIHREKHQPSLEKFIRSNIQELNATPCMFVSVSLSAASVHEKSRQAAKDIMLRFAAELGWRPTIQLSVAGAMFYSKYNWLMRMMMRKIAAAEGGDTDMSRDYEYTDWEKLEKEVSHFAEAVLKVATAEATPAK
jgi:menaquinone-dependent protoporphyrinogen oxidase